MNASTVNLDVHITTPDSLTASVRAHHPEEKALTGDQEHGWHFGGTMLPGQGLEIRLMPKEP
jgi:hypothetical protein